jgi:hypothetical protein
MWGSIRVSESLVEWLTKTGAIPGPVLFVYALQTKF